MKTRASDELIYRFFKELLIVVSDKYGLIVKFLGRCKVLLLGAIVQLFKVATNTLVILALFKMKIDNTLNLHL